MSKLNKKLEEILKKIIKEESESLFEAKLKIQEADPIIEPQAGQKSQSKPAQKPVATKPVQKPVATKPVQKQAATKPVQKQVQRKVPAKAVVPKQVAPPPAAKPPKTPEQQKLDAKRSRPPKPEVTSDVITRVQYQIFVTKLAMSRLDTQILATKFTESLHDFDLNISKNDKDPQKINTYILPVIGNIEALKNASEALQIEFNKLKALLDKALTPQ